MKRVGLILAVACLVLSCSAAEVSTNVVKNVVLSAVRTQCEVRTKSGTRCKRNAQPGEKLCRQHKKIEERRNSTQQPSGLEKRTPNA